MTVPDLTAVGNHLWQSTAFVLAAWVLTIVLRKNSARVRHGIWFAASVQFLVPVSWLIALGSRTHWRAVAVAKPGLSVAVDQVTQPFTAVTSLRTVPHAVNPLPLVLFVVWAIGALGIAVSWMVRYRRILVCARSASVLPLELPVRALSSSASMEPGVFGIFRPVLLLPSGIFDRLTESQLSAVIEHELCHVRHRDNLVASIQMFVETVFWFYPLVWWIGKRMVAERELACDEEVVRRGNARRSYAEGILRVCRLYAESPLVCASGVTGADLKKRIRAIVAGRVPLEMSVGRRVLVVAACLIAMAAPLIVGVVHAADSALAFEAVSIKLPDDPNGRVSWQDAPGEARYMNVAVKALIVSAYQIKEFQLLGAPPWISSTRYDVTARVSSGRHVDFPADPMTATDHQRETLRQQRAEMMRTMLADRFGLVVHKETREMPVYVLTVAKGGPKLRDNGGKVSNPDLRPGMVFFNSGSFVGAQVDVPYLAQTLAELADRPIVDKTGLGGKYDIEMKWSPALGFSAPDDAGGALPDGPSLFTALREQLGLRLDSGKGPVEVVVIDRVERPSEN